MKYYSEKLNKYFGSEKECLEEEQKIEKTAADKKAYAEERRGRCEEIQDAYKEAQEMKKYADDLLRKFIRDYGGYHTTISQVPSDNSLTREYINDILGIFFGTSNFPF